MMKEVILTEAEAESLKNLLEDNLIGIIQSDVDIDNMEWLANIVNIWTKCKKAMREEE